MRLIKGISIAALVAALIVLVVPSSAVAKGVRTQIVVGDFSCYEDVAPNLSCSALGGLNSNKNACAGNRKMEVLFNGTKVASTKSDVGIHDWSFDDFTIQGAGTLTIVALKKHTSSVTCREAKRKYTVDAEGNMSEQHRAA
jgi:hypothetical protein